MFSKSFVLVLKTLHCIGWLDLESKLNFLFSYTLCCFFQIYLSKHTLREGWEMPVTQEYLSSARLKKLFKQNAFFHKHCFLTQPGSVKSQVISYVIPSSSKCSFDLNTRFQLVASGFASRQISFLESRHAQIIIAFQNHS